MKRNVLQVEYYNMIIEGNLYAASTMLSIISKVGISLLAYKSVLLDANRTQFTLYALRNEEMHDALRNEGLDVNGPFPGLFVHGDDVPGALAEIFCELAKADVQIEESNGIANINGGYGVVLYLSKADVERAYRAVQG
jgi:hypothetical protein